MTLRGDEESGAQDANAHAIHRRTPTAGLAVAAASGATFKNEKFSLTLPAEGVMSALSGEVQQENSDVLL